MYLDNHASTHIDPEVNKVFQEVILDCSIGNPHSGDHVWGWNAARMIEESQETIANFLNALPGEVYFTSGATESNNWAIIGTGLAARRESNPKNEIIVSSIEHKCVLNSANFLKEFHDFKIIEAPVTSDGILDIPKFEKLINDKTLLVSVMAVNNEIGTVQPLKAVGKLCRKYDAVFHVDGAQGGYSNLDVIENNIDMLSLSGHKIYAPIGIGVLFVSDDLSPEPVSMMNGGEQQNGLRAGTLSPALCCSMAKAIEVLTRKKEGEKEHLKTLRSLFLLLLKDHNVEFEINGSMKERHPGNLNIQLKNIDTKTLITRLQPKLAVSTGSACNAGVVTSSYVLKALGLSQEERESSLRIGFGRFNNKEQIKSAVDCISATVKELIY